MAAVVLQLCSDVSTRPQYCKVRSPAEESFLYRTSTGVTYTYVTTELKCGEGGGRVRRWNCCVTENGTQQYPARLNTAGQTRHGTVPSPSRSASLETPGVRIHQKVGQTRWPTVGQTLLANPSLQILSNLITCLQTCPTVGQHLLTYGISTALSH